MPLMLEDASLVYVYRTDGVYIVYRIKDSFNP